MKTAHNLWRDLLRQVRLFPLALLLLTALPLAAQVPGLINYQGRLTDGSGNAVAGNRTMVVSLYDAATGGNLTYSETIGTVSVANGTYSFQFGASGNGIVSALSGQDYLALTINGTEETTRTRLLAVPFALQAKESADTQALNTQVTSLNGTVASLQSQTSTLSSNLTSVQAQTQSVSEILSGILADYKVLGLSGNLTFGNTTTSGLLTISNSGFRPLRVSGISYPAGFSGNWTGTIAPEGSQSVAVTFSPTAVQGYSGNISVTSDATSGTGTIAVSGQVARLVSLSGDLAFGNGTVNVPNRLDFTIANTGNMDLTVSGISYPAAFSGNWNGTIAPGRSQSVTATFTPTAVQSYGGNLSVASNATGGSGLLSLIGTGRAAGVTTNMVTVAGGTLPESSELSGQNVATFQIGKYEVSWGEWKEVRAWGVANGYSDLNGVGDTDPSGSADNFPVIKVSWYDAVKWMNARSEKEGLTPVYQVSEAVYKTGESAPTLNSSANGYRMPTEAEWEWAARGGASSQGYTYSGSNDVNAVAWYYDNSSDRTKAVGTKAANELVIHDMSGNVWEWCEDVAVSSIRRIRGGSWSSYADFCTVANRDGIGSPDSRHDYFGFRLARSSGN
jgi:formylglycine-generating enzyme required for sulfatase activity